VEACLEIEAGPGRVVTGLYRHSRGVLYDLWLEGSERPIGITLSHPVWSEDRSDWVPASALEPGERVRTLRGPRAVLSLLPRGESLVYNIEVDGDHCYRVGEQGLLVHNHSDGDEDYCDPEDKCVADTKNEPCWMLDTDKKYRYKSPGQVCGLHSASQKSAEVDLVPRSLDCPGDGPNTHVTCNDPPAHPGWHDSAISCSCCDSDSTCLAGSLAVGGVFAYMG
jgi:hypothetical protein